MSYNTTANLCECECDVCVYMMVMMRNLTN